MNRLLALVVLVGATAAALAPNTANAQFTPLGARLSIKGDVTIYRTLGGEVNPCLAPAFDPSPDVVVLAPQIGFFADTERSVVCEDVTLYVEQTFQVIELEEQPSYYSPGKAHVVTTTYLSYANNPQVMIEIGEDEEDWDLTSEEFWKGHPVRSQPGVTFNSNHHVDTVTMQLVQH